MSHSALLLPRPKDGTHKRTNTQAFSSDDSTHSSSFAMNEFWLSFLGTVPATLVENDLVALLHNTSNGFHIAVPVCFGTLDAHPRSETIPHGR